MLAGLCGDGSVPGPALPCSPQHKMGLGAASSSAQCLRSSLGARQQCWAMSARLVLPELLSSMHLSEIHLELAEAALWAHLTHTLCSLAKDIRALSVHTVIQKKTHPKPKEAKRSPGLTVEVPIPSRTVCEPPATSEPGHRAGGLK